MGGGPLPSRKPSDFRKVEADVIRDQGAIEHLLLMLLLCLLLLLLLLLCGWWASPQHPQCSSPPGQTWVNPCKNRRILVLTLQKLAHSLRSIVLPRERSASYRSAAMSAASIHPSVQGRTHPNRPSVIRRSTLKTSTMAHPRLFRRAPRSV